MHTPASIARLALTALVVGVSLLVAHAAPPPESSQGPHRISVLLSYAPEGARHHRGEAHYNDVIFQGEGGEAPNMTQVAARR